MDLPLSQVRRGDLRTKDGQSSIRELYWICNYDTTMGYIYIYVYIYIYGRIMIYIYIYGLLDIWDI